MQSGILCRTTLQPHTKITNYQSSQPPQEDRSHEHKRIHLIHARMHSHTQPQIHTHTHHIISSSMFDKRRNEHLVAQQKTRSVQHPCIRHRAVRHSATAKIHLYSSLITTRLNVHIHKRNTPIPRPTVHATFNCVFQGRYVQPQHPFCCRRRSLYVTDQPLLDFTSFHKIRHTDHSNDTPTTP